LRPLPRTTARASEQDARAVVFSGRTFSAWRAQGRIVARTAAARRAAARCRATLAQRCFADDGVQAHAIRMAAHRDRGRRRRLRDFRDRD
jgi:hypothetical protein